MLANLVFFQRLHSKHVHNTIKNRLLICLTKLRVKLEQLRGIRMSGDFIGERKQLLITPLSL